MEEFEEEPLFCKVAKRLMPSASEEQLLEAADNLLEFAKVANRICERLMEEEEEKRSGEKNLKDD